MKLSDRFDSIDQKLQERSREDERFRLLRPLLQAVKKMTEDIHRYPSETVQLDLEYGLLCALEARLRFDVDLLPEKTALSVFLDNILYVLKEVRLETESRFQLN